MITGAALPPLSRCLRLSPNIEPAMTVFAFVNEEPPFFTTERQGSVYAEAARRRGDDIRLMASIETIGCYSDKPDSQSYPPLFELLSGSRKLIGIVSNFRSWAAMRRLAAAFRANSDFPLRPRRSSLLFRRLLERPSIVLAARLSCGDIPGFRRSIGIDTITRPQTRLTSLPIPN